MSKRTIAPRERLRRQGNFWEEGMPLTDEDREILSTGKETLTIVLGPGAADRERITMLMNNSGSNC